MVLGVDVGGTFTDAVLVAAGRLWTAKAPTTPGSEARGVEAAIDAVLSQANASAAQVRTFAHGMTVATNALLEGRGARTALVATRGFTDVVELGRQARADLYRLCAQHPAPFAPPELRFGARERCGPHGPIEPLSATDALLDALAQAAPEAVAVVLLHSYAHPEHERQLGELIAARLPGVHVSLSHELVGTFREYERAATTEIDAALSPLLGDYLAQLGAHAGARGLPAPAIMQSSGGLTDAAQAARHAAACVLSGPAGGAQAGLLLGTRAGERNLLCFDMGGTSCDVSMIEDGELRESTSRTVAGRPLALPMLDIHTVGAGGGSIAWRDAGGVLRVGPHSAGAEPGPACYGRGGSEPTVTDANVALGYLPAQIALADGTRLDGDAARAAIEPLARSLQLDLIACAAGIVRVANAEMVRAMRVMTVERGIDPRRFTLLPFGGAGPLHAAHVAEELGITRLLCPGAAGVLSALGLAAAPPRRDAARSVLGSGDVRGRRAVADLRRRLRAELGREPARERVRYEMRYRGQSFELSLDEPGRAAFDAAHTERYGYADPDAAVELVTVRVSVWGEPPALALDAPAGGARERAAAAWFAGAKLPARLFEGAPAAVSGPAICALGSSTLLVPPGWAGAAAADGSIVLEFGR